MVFGITKTDIQEIRTTINKIYAILEGVNGQGGLKERVTKAEDCAHNADETIKTRTNWIWTTLVFVVGIGSVLIDNLWSQVSTLSDKVQTLTQSIAILLSK
jgi:hypothetical protein